jgi:SUR7/PalI family
MNDTMRTMQKANVTFCSKPKGIYWFDPRVVLDDDLHTGVTLEDLNWPDDIDGGLEQLKTTSHAMFVFFVLTVAASGTTVGLGLAQGITGSRWISIVTFGFAFVSHPPRVEAWDRLLITCSGLFCSHWWHPY